MAEELVWVTPRSVLGEWIRFRGFRDAHEPPPSAWMEAAQFKPRAAMEQDPTYKQLVPYIVLRSGGLIFRYWRTKKSGESRLHHLYSIGVGGHINPHDDNLFSVGDDLMLEAARRELNEEVRLAEQPRLTMAGFINDDDTEVGRVHLGVVFEARLDNPQVDAKEQALGRGEWKPLNELLDGAEYESWSRFVIDQFLLHPTS
jgi:predicted NUDIX family phosphoesterase